MNKVFLSLFPTLLAIYDNFLSENECSLIFNFCKNKNIRDHNEFVGDGKSSYGLIESIIADIEINTKELWDISSRLQFVINDYSKEFGIENNLLTNSWFNFQQQDSLLKQHSHAYSIVSGALYINVDDDSSCIYFQTPNPYISFPNFLIKNQSQYISPTYEYKPKNGSLVLFPSWLNHGSMYNKNKTKDRLVISFNTKQKNFI